MTNEFKQIELTVMGTPNTLTTMNFKTGFNHAKMHGATSLLFKWGAGKRTPDEVFVSRILKVIETMTGVAASELACEHGTHCVTIMRKTGGSVIQ